MSQKEMDILAEDMLDEEPINSKETAEPVEIKDGIKVNKETGQIEITNNGAEVKYGIPFEMDEYFSRVTNYGVLFWRHDELKQTEDVLSLPYYTVSKPDFRFFDLNTKEFTILPEISLPTAETTFDAPDNIISSNSERKLLISIGHFDINSDAFKPGFISPLPIKSYSIVYDIASNSFENNDPLSILLEIINQSTPSFPHIIWDSLGERFAVLPGGEGCGHFNTIEFVNIKNKTVKIVGGKNSYNFAEGSCIPSNGASQDNKWMVLVGVNKNRGVDSYLFDISGEVIKQKSLDVFEESNYGLWAETWNLDNEFPVITLRDQQVIDFNE